MFFHLFFKLIKTNSLKPWLTQPHPKFWTTRPQSYFSPNLKNHLSSGTSLSNLSFIHFLYTTLLTLSTHSSITSPSSLYLFSSLEHFLPHSIRSGSAMLVFLSSGVRWCSWLRRDKVERWDRWAMSNAFLDLSSEWRQNDVKKEKRDQM